MPTQGYSPDSLHHNIVATELEDKDPSCKATLIAWDKLFKSLSRLESLLLFNNSKGLITKVIIAANTPIIEITTKSSTRVNPDFDTWTVFLKITS